MTKKKLGHTKRRENGSLIEVRESGIHGTGVYAKENIPKGARIIEYTGERISWKEAQGRGPRDPEETEHTFFFGLANGKDVIDAGTGGNESRWINHSCAPNCEAKEKKGHIFISAIRNLRRGEELSYDYALELDEPRTKKLERESACHCGSKRCRGTMLGPT